MKPNKATLAILFGLGLIPTLAMAQDTASKEELIAASSLTLTDEQFPQGNRNAGSAVTVTGELKMQPGWPPYPVVVLLHATDGPSSGAVWNWNLD
jgi:hypothetical protein